MKSIREECNQYSLICCVKSDSKDAEFQNESLKEKLRKLQKDCMDLNSRVVSINWKIQQASFVLDCERKKHGDLYEVMKKAENKYTNDDTKNFKFIDYLRELEKKKSSLVMQVNQQENK